MFDPTFPGSGFYLSSLPTFDVIVRGMKREFLLLAKPLDDILAGVRHAESNNKFDFMGGRTLAGPGLLAAHRIPSLAPGPLPVLSRIHLVPRPFFPPSAFPGGHPGPLLRPDHRPDRPGAGTAAALLERAASGPLLRGPLLHAPAGGDRAQRLLPAAREESPRRDEACLRLPRGALSRRGRSPQTEFLRPGYPLDLRDVLLRFPPARPEVRARSQQCLRVEPVPAGGPPAVPDSPDVAGPLSAGVREPAEIRAGGPRCPETYILRGLPVSRVRRPRESVRGRCRANGKSLLLRAGDLAAGDLDGRYPREADREVQPVARPSGGPARRAGRTGLGPTWRAGLRQSRRS